MNSTVEGFRRVLLSILSFLLLQPAARADILFINLNNSVLERNACETAATARGEKCRVIPVLEAETVQALSKVDSELGSLYSKIDKGKLERASVQSKIDELTKKKEELSPKLDKSRVAAAIAELKKADPALGISSIVLSGHHASGEFTGLDGSIKASELKEIFKASGDTFNETRSLFLAGCYTGNLGTINFDWKDLTPNLGLIIGYSEMAPAGSWKPGADFMEDALKSELEILNSQTKPELEETFKKLKVSERGLKATICVNDCLVSGKGVENIEEKLAECLTLQENPDFQKSRRDFDCYMAAETADCANPPDDMDRGSLRKSYNRIQEKSHCADILAEKGSSYPDENRYSLLVHNKNVMENMARLEGDGLRRLARDLAEIGVEFDPAVFSSGEKDQRKKLVEEMKKVQAQLDRKHADPEFLLGAKGLKTMKAEVRFWNVRSIADMWPGCLPFDWVNKGSIVPSPCRDARVSDSAAKDKRKDFYESAIGAKAVMLKEKVALDVKVKTDTGNGREWTARQKAALAQALDTLKKEELDRIRRLVPAKDRAPLERALEQAVAS